MLITLSGTMVISCLVNIVQGGGGEVLPRFGMLENSPKTVKCVITFETDCSCLLFQCTHPNGAAVCTNRERNSRNCACFSQVRPAALWEIQRHHPQWPKPLEVIFKRPLASAPCRLQSIVLTLQRYTFQVEYRKGSTLHIADTLSRAPLPVTSHQAVHDEVVYRVEFENCTPDLSGLQDASLQEIRDGAATDPGHLTLFGRVRMAIWQGHHPRSSTPLLVLSSRTDLAWWPPPETGQGSHPSFSPFHHAPQTVRRSPWSRVHQMTCPQLRVLARHQRTHQRHVWGLRHVCPTRTSAPSWTTSTLSSTHTAMATRLPYLVTVDHYSWISSPPSSLHPWYKPRSGTLDATESHTPWWQTMGLSTHLNCSRHLRASTSSTTSRPLLIGLSPMVAPKRPWNLPNTFSTRRRTSIFLS